MLRGEADRPAMQLRRKESKGRGVRMLALFTCERAAPDSMI